MLNNGHCMVKALFNIILYAKHGSQWRLTMVKTWLSIILYDTHGSQWAITMVKSMAQHPI